jgi:DNA-directed RNA polymerase, mitochondrial
MTPDLTSLQASIEQDMAASRESKLLSVPAKGTDFNNTPAGIAMLRNSLTEVSKAIREWIEDIKAKKAGRYHAEGVVLLDTDPDVIAYITIKTVLGVAHKPGLSMVKIGNKVAMNVQRELWLEGFRRHNRKLYDELMRDMARRNNNKDLKQGLVTWAATKDGFQPMEPWPATVRTRVGLKLIEILAAVTGWYEFKIVKSRTRQTHYLLRTKTFNLFAEYWLQTAYVKPDYLPTVVPPKPWTSHWGGGYHTDSVSPLTLIKTHDAETLNINGSNQFVLDAINALQNVGWRINRQVLDVFEEAVAARLPISALPAETHGIQYVKLTEDMDDEERARQRLANIRKFEAVREADAQWITVHQIKRMAHDYKDHEFWFPYSMDFRGRMYPMVAHLNPQGTDAAKGLLVFSKGKPLTKAGWQWLMIHGANSWDNGLTKESFEARIDFIKRNEQRILQCAEHPLDDTYWSGAENPWQFLAFCFEYARLKRDPSADSVLPIGMDGTCNGLQHFSAMLRDPVGGSATNLVPSPRPSDIYQRVADVVTARLKELAGTSAIAAAWLQFGVDRKATKRQVMTLPYGSTRFSCFRYTRDWFNEVAPSKGGSPFPQGGENEAITYLANIIWESIDKVVVAARAAMDWLRQVADVVGAQPIYWTTPTGLVVKQQYNDVKSHLIRTSMMGKIIRPRVFEMTDKVSTFNQRNGISPNFVHSYDAAHVKLTIHMMLKYGMDVFAFVHDSYLCLASDADSMAAILRQAFVELHHKPALHALAAELQAKGFDVPLPPPVGDLDLHKVHSSPYFFA